MHLMHDYAVARIGRRHARWGHCACLLAFAVGPCTGTTYAADTTLTQWRMQALQVRALAENDAVEAYARAVKLQVLPAGATVEDQVSGLNLLARTELYLAMTEDAGSHAERALALATAQNDRLGQARADLVLALNTVNQGRIERLQEVVHQAVKVLDGFPQPALQAEATLRLAMLYNRLGQFEESVRVCVQSLQNAAASKKPEALAYAHHCMAISVGLGGNTSSARPHYEAMAQAARQSGSRLMLAQAITGQAAEIALREDHRRSEPLLREALHIYSQVGAPFFILYALSALAYNQSHQGRHADALRLRSEVIAGFERYPNRIALWWVLMGRAVDYIKLSNFSAALADTQRAYRIATDIGLYNYVSDSARQLGVLAAQRRPHLFDSLVLIAPSPSYLNDGDYAGGFERDDIDSLLDTLESNHFGWAQMMAPVIMGNPERPELAGALGDSFCRMDSDVARHFARVTFLADHRDALAAVPIPSLLLQCSDDDLAALSVGDYLARRMPDSELVHLAATGHCPHMSAPAEVVQALTTFLRRRG